ncbi:signal recognition particle 19 kDa protein-like [Penaeus chinensis]|uniref:signal recognition particle 19 kDa protein-like n=1 Tax=Penaeus chinensis TaxID=139456 RepID=UPI001FB6309F|nr:signal recognition particle 19 kDa protein-like [Penaeus chinensis]
MAAAAARPMPKRQEGFEKWICLYPAYINKDKSRAEGRRIPKEKAVTAPTFKEIIDVLSVTGLQVAGERKIYCREKSKEPPYWGRIRVQLKSPDGDPIDPNFKTREDLMVHVAEKIPQLKSRTNPKQTQETQQQPQQGKQAKGKKRK